MLSCTVRRPIAQLERLKLIAPTWDFDIDPKDFFTWMETVERRAICTYIFKSRGLRKQQELKSIRV